MKILYCIMFIGERNFNVSLILLSAGRHFLTPSEHTSSIWAVYTRLRSVNYTVRRRGEEEEDSTFTKLKLSSLQIEFGKFQLNVKLQFTK